MKKCDPRYKDIQQNTNFLYKVDAKYYLNFSKFGFAVGLNSKLKIDFFSLKENIEGIVNNFVAMVHQRQSKSLAMIKFYHRNLKKIILEFDLDNILINQTRHYFPFLE